MSLWQDLRVAVRMFRRTPLLTAIALFTIALSVSATAVVFAAVKSVLLEPLPYSHPNDLVVLRTDFDNAQPSAGDWIFWDNVQEVTRRSRTLQPIGIYRTAIFNLASDASARPEALYGLRVTAELFPTLGVAPMLGRNIAAEEDQPGHAEEMILSYGLWKRRFHADPKVVGTTVRIDGRDCLIIGVMLPNFDFPLRRVAAHTPSPYVDFWAPLRNDPKAITGGLGAVARLRPGVSLAQAQAEIASISAALRREFPATNRDRTIRLNSLESRTLGNSRDALWLLMGAAGMFLLIGYANVANLLLARGVAREREIAVRMALGAGRSRIFRQLLTESCALAVAGGLGAFALTAATWKVLPAIVPVSIPRLSAAKADWEVLAFAVAAALANGMIFGLIPALRATARRDVTAIGDFAVHGAAVMRDHVRAVLVTVEVAISVVLVIVGGQLLEGFIRVLKSDPGFQADRVVASVILPSPRYKTREDRTVLYGRIVQAMHAVPGIQSVGTVDALPFSGENHGGSISASGVDPASQIMGEIDVIGGQYLQALGVQLRQGRWFDAGDEKDASDVAIVNEALAGRFWPGESAVAKQICLFCTPENGNHWKRVVGVVSDMHHAGVDGTAQPSVYLSADALGRAQFLVVRSDRTEADLQGTIRTAVAAVDPEQPVFFSASMRSLIADSVADRRFIMTLLAITACLALLLAAAGVYGVTSYVTTRRTHEIGIRMALGATPGSVHRLIFRQGLKSVVVGVAAGLATNMVVLRVFAAVLVGLGSASASHAWIAVVLVTLTTASACWVPARQAIRVHPMSALRHE